MLKNYLLMVIRFGRRDLLSSGVNLLSLTTGILVFVFAFGFADYERSFDSFFANSDRIAVPYIFLPKDSPFPIEYLPSFFPGLAYEADRQFPDVQASTLTIRVQYPVTVNARSFPQEILFVTPSFLEIFDLEIIEGQRPDWRDNHNSVLISEQAALYYFGDQGSVGKSILLDSGFEFEIVGIYADLPLNSHLVENSRGQPRMAIMAPMGGLEFIRQEAFEGNWSAINSETSTYLLLSKNADRSALENDITAFVNERLPAASQPVFGSAKLTSLNELHLKVWDEVGIPAPEIAVGIGYLILFLALVNTASLNTAKLIARRSEIGLRRILGASHQDLMIQLTTESAILTLVALMLAVGLVYELPRWLPAVAGYELHISSLSNPHLLLYIGGVALVSVVLSTSYPIVLLFRMKIRGSVIRTLTFDKPAALVRKTLAGIHFAVVTALVLGILVIDRQNDYLIAQAPSFDEDNIIILSGLRDPEAPGRIDVLRDQIEQLSGVRKISRSGFTPYSGNLYLAQFKVGEVSDSSRVFQVIVADENYFDLFDISLIAGRNFDLERGQDVLTAEELERGGTTRVVETIQNVIINESAMRELGIKSAGSAIGEVFYRGASEYFASYRIIGVASDKRLNGVDTPLRPAVFLVSPSEVKSLSIRFSGVSAITRAGVEDVVREVLPGVPVKMSLLSEVVDTKMGKYREVRKGLLIISIVSVAIAMSGLYALGANLVQTRQLEMGIRKVLGARTGELAALLGKQFVFPLASSSVIGALVGWWSVNEYLNQFPERISVGLYTLMAAVLISIVLAAAAMGLHLIKLATVRPAQVLRHE